MHDEPGLARVPDGPVQEVSKLDDMTLFMTLKGWWTADRDHSAQWRKQAILDFDFVANDQWEAKTRAARQPNGGAR